MTKEDPMMSMNTKNEHYDSTKSSSDKNFTEKLGSKIKKTIKNSSNKMKKGLDKTIASMDDDHEKKAIHDNDNGHEHSYHNPLTERDSEPYDINYNDPYFREHNTSNRYQYFGANTFDRNGNEITKEHKEQHFSGDDNNKNDYYDEFSNYTTAKSNQDANAIPNYSGIVVEDTKKDHENSDGPDYVTKNLKSLSISDPNNDSAYHQISKTLESRENGLSDEEIKKTTPIAPPPPLPPNLTMTPSHDDRSESNSETGIIKNLEK